MAESVAAEKALNQQCVTTGDVGRRPPERHVPLEATISEVSDVDHTSSFTLGLAGAAASQGSSTDVLAPDDRYRSTRKDSVDRSLRSAIEEAIADLAKRLGTP